MEQDRTIETDTTIGKDNSIGFVETKYYNLEEDLKLETGAILKKPTIAYETYGKLNDLKSNVILVCHALTGNAHAAGWHEGDKKPGWWDIMIGPGKPLDTNKYFIICSNVLGSCHGSTGPSNINPDTNTEYGLDFPIITISDMVNGQKKLLDHLGLHNLFCVIGGSMGGMQVIQWAVSYPNMIRNAIFIASGAYSTTQQIAFDEVQRRAIIEDSYWNHGDYYHTGKYPDKGLSLARMIAHITYLSNDSMLQKFGRRLQDKEKFSYSFDVEFQVESYLKYQGYIFTQKFDANSYLYLTKALDYFDLRKNESLIEGLSSINCRMLVVSISSDWLYTDLQHEEIVDALRVNDVNVSYTKLNAEKGHDSFLIENGQLNYIIRNFLYEIRVKDILTRSYTKLHDFESIKDAAELMLNNNITHIPIVDKTDKIMGIVTAWDLSKAIAMNKHNIEEIMTKNVLTCYESDTLFDVAKTFKNHKISGLPVIDEDDHVIGVVTTADVSSLMGSEEL